MKQFSEATRVQMPAMVHLTRNGCLYHFPQIKPEMEDYKFIQSRISQQYINQYNATYGIA